MSRVGSKPLAITEGVDVTIEEKSGKFGGQKVTVKGPLGEQSLDLRKNIKVEQKEHEIIFSREDDSKFVKSLHGLYRTLVSNMIEGVTKGYEKKLEMVGIGYRSELKGNTLVISAGATHPYEVEAPEGITFQVDDKVNISVKGINKQLVGQVAAYIRSISKPEPYQGKGIRYVGEHVRRKAGKVAKGTEDGGE